MAIMGLMLAPTDWSFFSLIILAVSLGAILPDVDSDSGLPYHITFGSTALIAGALGFMHAINTNPGDYGTIALWTIGPIVIIWGPIGTLFKRFTHHRGLTHSVPAAAIAGLIAYTLAKYAGLEPWNGFLLGLALALGYILHLVLDEAWAAINFKGHLFIPNKALGSALKFTSRNRQDTYVIYFILAILILENGRDLISLFGQLLGNFS